MLGAATLAGLPFDVPRNRVADKGRDEVRFSGRNPPGDESAHEQELRPEDPGRPPGDECAGGGTGHATLVVAAETSLSRADLRPVRAGPCAISCGTDPETDLRPVRAGRVSAELVGGSPGSGRSGTGPAYVMRAQRDRIHPGSRHASPARQNPPRRDSREPTSHNSSSGDMTNSTPPGAPSGGARTPGAIGQERRGCRRHGVAAPTSSVGDPRPRGCHRAGPVPEGRRTGWWPRRRRWGPCPLPGGTRSSGSVGESESGARPRRRRRAGAARESRHHRREARRWRRGSPARGNRSTAVVPGDSPALQK